MNYSSHGCQSNIDSLNWVSHNGPVFAMLGNLAGWTVRLVQPFRQCELTVRNMTRNTTLPVLIVSICFITCNMSLTYWSIYNTPWHKNQRKIGAASFRESGSTFEGFPTMCGDIYTGFWKIPMKRECRTNLFSFWNYFFNKIWTKSFLVLRE